MVKSKTYSTPFSTGDTTRIELDSVQLLVPKGYYILNESGAKKSIKAAIDAKAYLEKFIVADTELGKMASKVTTLTMERDYSNQLVKKKDETITGLTKQLRTANFWKWTTIAVSTYVVVRITLNKSL